MRVCHITDTHIGITKPESLRKMFSKIAEEEFDLLLHTGDYCGGKEGAKSVASTVNMIREVYSGPFLSTVGNHDYWALNFNKNLDKIIEVFKDNSVHFIDRDGPYIHPAFPAIKFIGAAGWYTNPNPPSNDSYWMVNEVSDDFGMMTPINRYLLNMSERTIQKQMDIIDCDYQTTDTICFVSHFPVIKPANSDDYKGRFEDWSWSERIGNLINSTYGCKHFFNGHAHQLHTGEEMRYEPGSDYTKPAYRIWTIGE